MASNTDYSDPGPPMKRFRQEEQSSSSNFTPDETDSGGFSLPTVDLFEKHTISIRVEELVDSLAAELQGLICCLLDSRDLKSLRVVRKSFNDVTTNILFRQMFLSRLKRSWDNFFHICATPHLAHQVQTLTYMEFAPINNVWLDDSTLADLPWSEEQVEHSLVRIIQGIDFKMCWRKLHDRCPFALDPFAKISEFRRRMPQALDDLPNLRTLVSAPMPKDTILTTVKGRDGEFSITASHARNLAQRRGQSNDGFMQCLIPALFHLGPQIESLKFIDEAANPLPCTAFSRCPSHVHGSIFEHLTSLHLTLDHIWGLPTESMFGDNLAECLQSATLLEQLSLQIAPPHAKSATYEHYLDFKELFLLDLKTREQTRWRHLHSIGLGGLAIRPADLNSFIVVHRDILRRLTLRDCGIISGHLEFLAAIQPALELSSFQVEGTEGLSLAAKSSLTPLVDEDDVLRYINRKTARNPVPRHALTDGGFFVTSRRQWKTTEDLGVFRAAAASARDTTVPNDNDDSSEITEDASSDDSYQNDADSDTTSSSDHDSASEVI